MATLAIAGAGALLGSTVIGGSVGLQAGWLVGSVVGSLLFPGSSQNTEGPRLQDARVSTSAYGVPINVLHGTSRLAGNTFWAEDPIQKSKTEEVGKGSGPTQTTFTTTISFAVGFCEGPVTTIRKMWANGELIYDTTGASSSTKAFPFVFRFYPGAGDQEADPLIVSDSAQGYAPSWKDLCYVVFEDFPIDTFGIIPSITAELVETGVIPADIVTFEPNTAGEADGQDLVIDSSFPPPIFLKLYDNDLTPTTMTFRTSSIVNARGGTFTAAAASQGYYIDQEFVEGSGPASFFIDTSGFDMTGTVISAQCEMMVPVESTTTNKRTRITTAEGVVVGVRQTGAGNGPGAPAEDWHEYDVISTTLTSDTNFIEISYQAAKGYVREIYVNISFNGGSNAASVVAGATPEPEVTTVDTGGIVSDLQDTIISRGFNRLYSPQRGTADDIIGVDIDTGNVTTRARFVQHRFTDPELLAVEPATGDLFIYDAPSNTTAKIQGESGTVLKQNVGIQGVKGVPISKGANQTFIVGKTGTNQYTVTDTLSSNINTYTLDRGSWTVSNVHPGKDNQGVGYTVEKSTTQIRIVEFSLKPSDSVQIGGQNVGPLELNVNVIASIDNNDFVGVGVTSIGPILDIDAECYFSFVSNSVIGSVQMSPSSWIWKYSLTTNALLWATEVPFPFFSQLTPQASAGYSNIEGGTLAWRNDSSRLAMIDIATGMLDSNLDGLISYSNTDIAPGYWNADKNAFYSVDNSGDITKFISAGSELVSVSLRGVIYKICRDSNLEDDQIDLSGIPADASVHGFSQTRQTTQMEYIRVLATAFNFDFTESEGKLKFVMRGAEPVMTLTSADIIAPDDPEDALYVPVSNDAESIPTELYVTYLDIKNDYTQQTEQAKRPSSQDSIFSVRTTNRPTLELAIAEEAVNIKRLAYALLYEGWAERTSIPVRYPRDFLMLEATDVVTLDFYSSSRARIVSAEYGADNTLELTLRLEQSGNYNLEVIEDADEPLVETPVIPTLTLSQQFIMDIPLLRDVDVANLGESRLYHAAKVAVEDWSGANLFTSSDDVVFEVSNAFTDRPAYGFLSTTLPSVSSPYATDLTNSITVAMAYGGDQLESVSRLEMLNGSNRAAIQKVDGSWELVGFADVIDNLDGSFTLSTLLRGLRGTELEVDGHNVGDQFVLLNPDDLIGTALPLGSLDFELYYKAVTFNTLDEDTPSTPFTHTGKDLHPYPVVSQKAILNGVNIDFTWLRQTRLGGELVNANDTPPLIEDTEAYEIDIYNTSGDTVLRTLTTSSEFAIYEEADILADFGSYPTTIKVAIYQMSVQVGRGFGTLKELEIV